MANLPADKVVRRQAKQVRGGVIAEPDGPAVVNGHDAIGRCCQGYPNHVVRASCVGLGWIVAVSAGGGAGTFTPQPARPAPPAPPRQILFPHPPFPPPTPQPPPTHPHPPPPPTTPPPKTTPPP